MGTNSFNNRIRAKEFPIQLLGRSLSGDIQRGEPDFVANREFDAFVLGVVIAGLVVLRRLDTFDQIAMMRLEVFRESFRGRDRRGGRSEIDREGRMEAVVGIERRTIDRGLVSIVESERCDG